MTSPTIQQLLANVLANGVDPERVIRTATLKVIRQSLSGHLLPPIAFAETLIALISDQDLSVADEALRCLQVQFVARVKHPHSRWWSQSFY